MKQIYEDIKKILESKISNKLLYTIGIALVAMLIFSAGVSVGFHKASFGRAWGENYERNFGFRSDRPMFGNMFTTNNFPNSHGTVGKILKIELPTMIVQDKDNTEKVVLIKDDTQIQKMMSLVKVNNLSIDDYVIVIGSPNELGQIEAKLIRIIPSPEFLR